MSTMKQESFDRMERDWFWLLGYTYIRFKDEALVEGFDKKLELLRQNTIQPWIKEVNVDGDIKMAIEPAKDIHFNNHLQYDSATNTNKTFRTNVCIYCCISATYCLNKLYESGHSKVDKTCPRNWHPQSSRSPKIAAYCAVFRGKRLYKFFSLLCWHC